MYEAEVVLAVSQDHVATVATRTTKHSKVDIEGVVRFSVVSQSVTDRPRSSVG